MIWLDTKEEVDFDWFMEVLRNNELQVVSRKWTAAMSKGEFKDLLFNAVKNASEKRK